MAKLVVKLNSSGVRQLLRSQEMRAVCEERILAARQRCKDGYKSRCYIAPTRATGAIWAETAAARKDNAENNTLLKALQ